MRKKLQTGLIVLFICISSTVLHAEPRGIWLWKTYSELQVITSEMERNKFLNDCIQYDITDIYAFLPAGIYNNTNNITYLSNFVYLARCSGINCWALEGERSYFSDSSGPSSFYAAVQAMIDYNASMPPYARLVGFHADMEPHINQGLNTFHSGIADSGLSTTPGSGVWQSTEVLDREYLMRDWLTIYDTAAEMCHNAGVLFGAAQPFWLDYYYSEPIECTYNSIEQGVAEHHLSIVDDYCIMSYSTYVANIIDYCDDECAAADGMPAAGRPRVWAGVETKPGEGVAVSYGDAGSNKSGVLLDMDAVSAGLSGFDSFGGINIHDWASWMALSPASSDTSAPPQTNDLIDPDKPAGFTAESQWNGVVLSWQHPTNKDLAGVIIRRDMNRAPRSAYEGDLIYDGLQTSVTDITATEGRKYYYSAFAYDIFENKSDAATAETAFGDLDDVTYVRNRINILCSADDYVYFDSLAEQPDTLTVIVFDVNGHVVIELEDTNGDGVIRWDGCGDDNKPVPSGAYVYTADDGEKVTEVFIVEWCE